MSLIPLHPQRGLDPHLTFCRVCGGDAEEITLGAMRKAQLPEGFWVYANTGGTTKVCRDLIKSGAIVDRYDLSWEPVGEHEKIPATQPCNKCKEEQEEIVKGGIYLKCLKCGLRGIIKAQHQLAIDVRKASGIKAPNPVGFESEGCGQPGALEIQDCPLKINDQNNTKA